MKVFDHKNIVKLLGVCTKGEPAYAVMELMIHGMKQNNCTRSVMILKVFIWMRHSISLPADVLWGSFVTHSFLPHVGNERTLKDVCGEAIIPSANVYK